MPFSTLESLGLLLATRYVREPHRCLVENLINFESLNSSALMSYMLQSPFTPVPKFFQAENATAVNMLLMT